MTKPTAITLPGVSLVDASAAPSSRLLLYDNKFNLNQKPTLLFALVSLFRALKDEVFLSNINPARKEIENSATFRQRLELRVGQTKAQQ